MEEIRKATEQDAEMICRMISELEETELEKESLLQPEKIIQPSVLSITWNGEQPL